MGRARRAALLGLVLGGLAACTSTSVKTPDCAPCTSGGGGSGASPGIGPAIQTPPAAAAKPLRAASWDQLPGWGSDDLTQVWPALLESCRGLRGRKEAALWRPFCEEAQRVSPRDTAAMRRLLESRLQPYQLIQPDGGSGGLLTGYYEPRLHGARTRTATAIHPVYGVPDDLLTIELADVFPELKDKRVRGRLVGNKVVPYWSRADLEAQPSRLKAKVLAWVEDPIELFFLQIQGSGRIQLSDGSLIRVGYADQNGHPYQSIGKVLLDRGELKPGEASMQGIQAWARANAQNPNKVQAVLNANPSYVFFRILPHEEGGPLGALGVPLTPERSIAVDTRTTPLGAPVWLSSVLPGEASPSVVGAPLQRLVLAQDTGGAIKGVVRADYFTGYGPDAGAVAGRMKQDLQMWVLLPPGLAPKAD